MTMTTMLPEAWYLKNFAKSINAEMHIKILGRTAIFCIRDFEFVNLADVRKFLRHISDTELAVEEKTDLEAS